jgi:phosphoribosylformimino-5-aminoimidazole carboxamide ribotide isomerase
MRIVPVLDLQKGRVVRGVGGHRHDYRPISSPLSASSRPIDVARAFQHRFGLTEIYVADLDAIAGAAPALSTYAELLAAGMRIWVDAGIRDAEAAAGLAEAGIDRIIVGLETVAGPSMLESVCCQLGPGRVVFSLDLRAGVPLGDTSAWELPDAWSIARQSIALGVKQMLVLDLARVGLGDGTGTQELCGRLVAAYPEVQFAAGGGVRDMDDLRRLQQSGVGAVLVASALHDGSIQPEDLARL